jgi:LmbE family N-acetylglucosaminyl deacetylase
VRAAREIVTRPPRTVNEMPDTSANSRMIFLSPHPDDAVLSCGGWIYQLAQNGERPIVMTVFSGDRPAGVPLSSFALSLHERWQLGADAPARRRDEDRAACDRLGCYLLHLPFADAVYRIEPVTRCHLYDSEEAIFGEVRDRDVIEQVAEAVQARLQHASDKASLVVPLAAGKHVDHVITRMAAERLKADVIYYEDYPYAEVPERMTHVWGQAEGAEHEWVSETVGLSEPALRAKIEAFLLHRSQISTFYRDDEEVRQRMRAYAESVGQGSPAERYWRQV